MKPLLKNKYLMFFFILCIAGCGSKNMSSSETPEKTSMLDAKRLEGLVHAPDFPAGMEWLNTARPLSLSQLKGKIVLLDFWTFCCINCIHVIPELKKLEAKYPEELVVIGVHSAKFTNEKQTESIRQAILRYEIKHPVVNDNDFDIWNSYNVHAWPTLVLINPNGRVIGVQSGEEVFDIFDPIISETIKYFDAKKEINRKPLNFELEETKQMDSLLAFPGKIYADPGTKQLYVSDSNHNRILVLSPEGKILDVIGKGSIGNTDGTFEEAEFDHPQGIYAEGQTLYIADTENHLIRKADLKEREVTTLLGTGMKARQFNAAGKGRTVALNSPWDLLVHDGKLYMAMAGPHQLWVADLQTLEARPYAGSGREARIDGPLLDAALAQPSGITTDGKKLYFADSEVSSIRSADLDPSGKVETLIGEDLFEYGDIDGTRPQARLQHALGVSYHEGLLYVADTYNSKIKIIDPVKKTSITFAGTGKHGTSGGSRLTAEFNEPGGLTLLNGRLFIADTNNHSIRTLDLQTGIVSTLELTNKEMLSKRAVKNFKGRVIDYPEQTIKPGAGTLNINFLLPEGFKFTKNAPVFLSWESDNPKNLSFTKSPDQIDSAQLQFPYAISYQASPGHGIMTVDAVIYYCRTNSTLCLFDTIRIKVPYDVADKGFDNITIAAEVKTK